MEIKKTKKFTTEVIDELQRIEKEEGLTPENFERNAKKKNNPLHGLLEWDSNIAAYKYRLQQARVIINEVKIIIKDEEYFLYENVKVTIKEDVLNEEKDPYEEETTSREYKTCLEIKDNDKYRDEMLSSALGRLFYWKNKYEFYVKDEIPGIIKAISKLEKKYEKSKAS